MASKFIPYHVPTIVSGVVMTVIMREQLHHFARLVRRHVQIDLQNARQRIRVALRQFEM